MFAFYHGRMKNPAGLAGLRNGLAYAITSSYNCSIVHNSFVMPTCIAGVSR